MQMAAPVLPPPLRDGDCLTSDEFMRRWEAMPGLKHAELIDGIVHMPSPLSQKHSNLHVSMTLWLGMYAVNTPGCDADLEMTWLMGNRDVPQPDLTLRVLPEYGGQSRVEGEYAAGAAELVVEIAVSSRSRDLGSKLRLYERMGVREYAIAVAGQQQLLWNVHTPAGFQPLGAGNDGILRSRCFPGLWLDPAALWRFDRPGVLAVLQQGLATPEHAAFLTGLASAKR